MKNSQLLRDLREDGAIIIFLAAIFLIALKIVFYKESFASLIRISLALILIFLPGFCMLHLWREKLSYIERAIISVPLSTVLVGIISYYIGILGINI